MYIHSVINAIALDGARKRILLEITNVKTYCQLALLIHILITQGLISPDFANNLVYMYT